MKRVLVEALMVAGVGISLSLIANALSGGLQLTRDYFPVVKASNSVATALSGGSNLFTHAATSNKLTHHQLLAARLQQKGLRLGDSNTVFSLYQDPRYQQGSIAFLDARDDSHYQAGHVPSAHQIDYYHYQKYLESVMPAILTAEQVVVYCNGGDCEDSEFTALLLINAGVPSAKFTVYGGGFKEWKAAGWPVELGVRNSGLLTNYPTLTRTNQTALK